MKPMKSLTDFADIDVEAIAAAIEADAGEAVPGIRDALSEARRGELPTLPRPSKCVCVRPGSCRATA
jgi:hypothetical protein